MMKKLLTSAAAFAAALSVFASPQFVNLRPYVNFGLTDPTPARDGKGGFTDDGVSVQQIAYEDGTNKVYDSEFDLIDPAKNNGKAVMTFECKSSKTGLREVAIDLSDKNFSGECLSILHTSTKSPDVRYSKIGKIEITYSDGKKQSYEMNYAIDIMNGLFPQERSNCKIFPIEKGKNAPAYFYSQFLIANKPIKSIKFSTADLATWTVAAATVDKKFPAYTAEDKDWVETDMSEIAVKEGTALDVSKDFDAAPSGSYGTARLSPKGKIAFEKQPNSAWKFHGTVWYLGGENTGEPDQTKKNLAELGKILKRQGYNMLRFHTTDFLASPDPKRVQTGFDIYDYFIAEMAKNGIYLQLLIGNNGIKNLKAEVRDDIKMKMFMGDADTREAWKEHAQMQLNHVNPYTGLAWKDDPTFLAMEYWNEMELGLGVGKLNPETVALVNSEFRKYLKGKYGTFEELAKTDDRAFRDYKSIDEIDVLNRPVTQSSAWARFVMKKGRQFMAYCKKVIRDEIGYKGLIHQFNCGRSLDIYYLSAIGGEYNALNVYYNHPSAYMSLGSSVDQKSSYEDFISSWRAGAAKRIADRPNAFTEYNHCHWNQFKNEGGIAFGAYSALQDFDIMDVHSDAIKTGNIKDNYLQPFGVNNSPVMRVNEFLTYCLWMRGDAKKSPNRVELLYPEEFVRNSKDMSAGVSSEQSKIALMTGFTIDFENAPRQPQVEAVKTKPADLTIAPVGASKVMLASAFATTAAAEGDQFDLDAIVATLKQKGILPQNNVSSPKDGIFQSDTGEIIMDGKNMKATVITPKTEAAAIKSGSQKLDRFAIVNSTVPCGASVSSMDGKPIAESKRLVLTYATDNINSDMVLNKSRHVLLKNARKDSKILLRRGTLDCELRADPNAKYRLFALAVTGERKAEIPLAQENGVLKIQIDNSKYPFVFFELAAE